MLHFLIKSQQLKNKVLIKSQRHRSPLGKQRWPRNNTHRLLFERSSYTFSTVKGFGRDKQFMSPEGHSDCSVCSSYSIYEFMSVCKFCSLCRFRDQARQSRIPITNEVRELIVLLNNIGHCFHHKH